METWPSLIVAGVFTIINSLITVFYQERLKKFSRPTPKVEVLSVKVNESVTVKAFNLPVNIEFDIFVGDAEDRAAHGERVGSVHIKDPLAEPVLTYEIPAKFQNIQTLAVSFVKEKDKTFNFSQVFVNDLSKLPQKNIIPTISIVNVAKDQFVQVRLSNFPSHLKTWNVFMGNIGTKGFGGILVYTIEVISERGLYKFRIPSQLVGCSQIAIRFEDVVTEYYAEGYYCYNWFWNNTTGQ